MSEETTSKGFPVSIILIIVIVGIVAVLAIPIVNTIKGDTESKDVETLSVDTSAPIEKASELLK